MRWAALIPLAVLLLPAAQPEDPAKAVIDKAIAAAGGEANLARYPAATWKGQGVYYGGGPGIRYTGTWAVQPPERARIAVAGERDGQHFARTLVVNGDKGWV